MMTPNTLRALWGGTALLALGSLFAWLNARTQTRDVAAEARVELVEVIQLRRPVQAGAPLRPGMIRIASVPRTLSPRDAIRVDAVRALYGQRFQITASRGALLRDAHLVHQGVSVTRGLEGDFAYWIPVDEATTRWARAGDHVDLFATLPAHMVPPEAFGHASPPAGTLQRATSTGPHGHRALMIVQRARVLRVQRRHLIVRLRPGEEAIVTLAAAEGAVRVARRSADDERIEHVQWDGTMQRFFEDHEVHAQQRRVRERRARRQRR